MYKSCHTPAAPADDSWRWHAVLVVTHTHTCVTHMYESSHRHTNASGHIHIRLTSHVRMSHTPLKSYMCMSDTRIYIYVAHTHAHVCYTHAYICMLHTRIHMYATHMCDAQTQIKHVCNIQSVTATHCNTHSCAPAAYS